MKARNRGMDINFCPQCGSNKIIFKEFYDLAYECYYICPECGALFYVNNMEWKYGHRECGVEK